MCLNTRMSLVIIFKKALLPRDSLNTIRYVCTYIVPHPLLNLLSHSLAISILHTYIQENLEKFTEHLSWLSEQNLEEFKKEEKRSEVVNYTRVTETFLKNLLKSVEDGLDEGLGEEEVKSSGGGGSSSGGNGSRSTGRGVEA